jgi:hypothetical protein
VIALPAVPRYPFVMRVRRILTVFVLATVLASCGGGDAERVATEDPYAVLRAAPEATVDSGTAKVSYRIEIGSGQTVEFDGVVDMASGFASVDLEVPGAGTMQSIVQGTTMYLSIPEAGRQELGVDTPWVSMDLERAGEAATGITGAFDSSSDPTEGLAALRGVAKDGVRELGTETVRGVETTRYEADVDLQKALAEAGEITDPETFERFAEEMGSGDIHYDVWVDESGVVRRLMYRMPMPTGVRARFTMELYDFGEAELPDIPAPGDVTDITDEAIAQANQRES